ncbi:MAG: histidinol dehydrogenase, partial [Proteiniphilum sp.]|nr:histidinol dehydrogenase [Proteiniphilum sp.]
MKTISNPSQSKWKKLTERPLIKQRKLMDMVEKMFYDINRKGDKAVLSYSRQFDYVGQQSLEVDRETVANAGAVIPERLKQAIELARKNIETFHLSQREEVCKVETAPGV